MFEKLLASPHFRFMMDALIGLTVFCGLTAALLGPSSAAGLLPLGFEQAGQFLAATPPAAVTSRAALSGANDPNSLIILLAAVFSTLFALNLSFVRHIASAYRVARRPARNSQRPQESVTKAD